MFPLTVHSHYSLMRGTSSPQAICARARQLGYQGLALTDTDNLYGLWTFLKACRQENMTPIVGATVTEPGTKRQAVCLVENQTGYRHLAQLLTRRHCGKTFDLQKELPPFGEGLIVLTDDINLLTSLHQQSVTVVAALSIRPTAAGHLLRKAAHKLGIVSVAVPDAYFLTVEEYAVHRLLRAIAGNTVLSRITPAHTVAPDSWLASPLIYEERFAAWPDAVKNSHVIAERCRFCGPDFGIVLPPYEQELRKSPGDILRRETFLGARVRYGDDLSEPVVERLEYELAIIEQKNFSSYFLVVRDIVLKASRICGRGSGAASLVAYCLEITNVCPLKYNLYFERFLNPGRIDPPDIDVDFAWDERDAILTAVLQKYEGHAALVCNHVLFQPRMAIREVAKVYGIPDREIGAITRRLPWFSTDPAGNDFMARMKKMPELKEIDFASPWPEIMHLARQLVSIPRYLSVHPGGVIITPRPIAEYVPVELAPKGVPIIQWEKDGAEEAGLVKIDLLGNRSLGVIRDAIANVRGNGVVFETVRWEPEDDERTRQTVAQGKTMGCFYIESPAMRLLQQKAATGNFEQLVLQSSIIRPAANDCIQEYLRRLHGGEWQPLHPELVDVLNETFGIMVYQEDVSRVAVALAGFSHVDADALRKVMSKKDKSRVLADYRQQFFAGAAARAVSQETCEAVWQMIMSFSGYSFCKPHSASYARVSFQAAYLKTHYPAEFMAAVISNQGGFYSTFAYVSEARRSGLTILPPDVNKSEDQWTGRGRTLRVGLMAMKGLDSATRKRIITCRRQEVFLNAGDFCRRVQPGRDEARVLIYSGALDDLGEGRSRNALLWEYIAWRQTSEKRGAPSLFRDVSGLVPPSLPAQNRLQQYRKEYQMLGFLCRCHPMRLFTPGLQDGRVSAGELHRFIGRRVRFAGWLITGKLVSTKNGEPMEFLTYEDETGLVETTFFPKAYQRFCHLLQRNRAYLLIGLVEENYGAITLTVENVERLSAGGGSKGGIIRKKKKLPARVV